MTAGDCNDRAGWENARASDDTLINGALEPEGRSAKIANSGESAKECIRCFGSRHQGRVADVSCHGGGGSRPHEHRVPVHVDQTRHQRSATAIEQDSVSIFIGGDRGRGNMLDLVSAHEHVRRARELPALSVEDADVLEQNEGQSCGLLSSCR
jgi:hypothetical protein